MFDKRNNSFQPDCVTLKRKHDSSHLSVYAFSSIPIADKMKVVGKNQETVTVAGPCMYSELSVDLQEPQDIAAR